MDARGKKDSEAIKIGGRMAEEMEWIAVLLSGTRKGHSGRMDDEGG